MDLGLDLAACQCDEWFRAADEAVVPESWFYRWRRTKYPRSPDDISNSNQIYKRKKAIDNQLVLVACHHQNFNENSAQQTDYALASAHHTCRE